MGQSPKADAVSLRTFNRNFYGRSGTASANVYLVSPEVAAYSALNGVLSDPREIDILPVEMPDKFMVNDSLLIFPADDASEVVRGENIKPFPVNSELGDEISAKVLLKMPDNITTDHIMPSNSKLLPYRSNIPYLANFCLTPVDETFPERAKSNGGGFLVAGENYGQGSSREHAALVPLYLGIKAVFAKSFARIHKSNLINSGILPLTFENAQDYDKISLNDKLKITGCREKIVESDVFEVTNETSAYTFKVRLDVSQRQRQILLYGGLLNYTKKG